MKKIKYFVRSFFLDFLLFFGADKGSEKKMNDLTENIAIDLATIRLNAKRALKTGCSLNFNDLFEKQIEVTKNVRRDFAISRPEVAEIYEAHLARCKEIYRKHHNLKENI